jgi:hypothetical protein
VKFDVPGMLSRQSERIQQRATAMSTVQGKSVGRVKRVKSQQHVSFDIELLAVEVGRINQHGFLEVEVEAQAGCSGRPASAKFKDAGGSNGLVSVD